MKWVVFTMWTMAAIVGLFGEGTIASMIVGITLLFGGVLVCDLDEKREKRLERRELEEHLAWDKYTVWVGGGEVNDHLLSKKEADSIAESYRKQGYDDVFVERVK